MPQSLQTADKGTEHEKRKYGYYKVKISGKISPKFLYIFIFFRLERTSAHSTQYSSRLGSSHLYSFSAVCQADDKVCHQLYGVILKA